ncbi:putative inactive poly [ADP-ribose] polymerase SRO5 [Bidens hawaiensis]|uniref:putative inactive poly [ADP-ribose] polymerase SRO5 n=1 Tax=Bidens hawaiensis TaxID=980011 RepID=UPI0040494928
MEKLLPFVADRRIIVSEDEGDSSCVLDCESSVSGTRVVEPGSIELNGLVWLDESDRLYGMIGSKFVSRLSELGVNVEVGCIHRNMFSASVIAQARVSSFQIFRKAVEKRNGGDANVKYAWFGGSKDEIENIVQHGFGYGNIRKDGLFDHGVVLCADHSPLESVQSAIADEDGNKHILLCRVLLGKTELVNRGSKQSHPSSDSFQSGVDDLVSPKKYIVWSSHMNTHILPEFLISFKTPTRTNNKPRQDGTRLKKPISPWIPIPELLAALSKVLPPKAIKEMTQFRQRYIEHKISRCDMIRRIRRVTGDRLLLMVLKNFTEQRQCNRFG